MTREQFEDYLQAVNDRALPLVPLINCNACGYPIEDECVIITTYDPPRWLHLGCDDEPETEPGFFVGRHGDD